LAEPVNCLPPALPVPEHTKPHHVDITKGGRSEFVGTTALEAKVAWPGNGGGKELVRMN
jgi:hypothetical protein